MHSPNHLSSQRFSYLAESHHVPCQKPMLKRGCPSCHHCIFICAGKRASNASSDLKGQYCMLADIGSALPMAESMTNNDKVKGSCNKS